MVLHPIIWLPLILSVMRVPREGPKEKGMRLPNASLTPRGMSALYLHGPPVWVLNGGFGPKMVNHAYTLQSFQLPVGRIWLRA